VGAGEVQQHAVLASDRDDLHASDDRAVAELFNGDVIGHFVSLLFWYRYQITLEMMLPAGK
jgi:hypothetical protein